MALGKTVRELLAQADAAEIVEWALYFGIEPPEQDADWRAGMVCSTIAAGHGVRRKPESFMPKRKRPKRMTVDEHIRAMKAMMGGKGSET